MLPEALDRLFFIYNGIKLINSKEDRNMLFVRDDDISRMGAEDDPILAYFYTVNDHKKICISMEKDRSIRSIGLLDSLVPFDTEYRNWLDLKQLCYIENITFDDGKLLKSDALIRVVEQEEAE